jgi:CubicO group peptidase (beta-lactamase class C family)
MAVLGAPANAESPDPAAIDAVFAAYDSTHKPGCSLGVYRDGQIELARGYGMANLEYGIANGPHTVFRIGSTSKQFTAMAIALLAEQGKLSLDEDIRRFFPDLPDYGEPVTVRQLIHHTSGLRDYLELAWLADWPESYTDEEAVGMILRQQELNFPPGTEHLYSNSGYFLASRIVQKVTGMSLRAWADENMFQPLGMHDTHFHDDHRHIVKNRADGYAAADTGGYRISMTILDMVGDGGIYTTVNDLLNWERNFHDNRLGKGGQGLIELMETPGTLKNGDTLDYAFGLGVGQHAGTREISHGGAFVGYRAGYNRYPEHQLGVAVFCNYADTNPTALARQVASLYLEAGAEEDAATAPSTDAAAASNVIELSPAALTRVAGDYWNASQLMARAIVVEDGLLWYDRGNGNRSRLDPLADGSFLMAGVSAVVKIGFEPGEAAVRAMTVEVAGQDPLHFKRLERVTPTAGELAALAGVYFSPELDHRQQFKVDGEALVAPRREGDEGFRPLFPDSFISDQGMMLEFQRDASGAVNGFHLHSGRVRNVIYLRE